jgi:hypothetical protein
MNKRGQMAFSPEEFSQGSPSEEPSKPNLFLRIAQGIAAIVFVVLFTPVIVGIHSALLSYVCDNPTVCLFFKFIVPAFIIGGIAGAIRYMWSKS